MQRAVVAGFVLAQRARAAGPARARHREEHVIRLGHGRHLRQLGPRLEERVGERIAVRPRPHALQVVHVHVGEPVLRRIALPEPVRELRGDALESVLPLRRHRLLAEAGELLESLVEAAQLRQRRMIDERPRREAVGQENLREARNAVGDEPRDALRRGAIGGNRRRPPREQRIAAGEDRCVRGHDLGRRRPRLQERRALLREAVEDRRRRPIVAVAREVIGAQRVDRDHEHPASARSRGRLRAAGRAELQRATWSMESRSRRA